VTDVQHLIANGATVLTEFPRWTVLADPEGGEFCAFVRDSVADYRLCEICVDSADPAAQATWWAGVLGGQVGHDADEPWYSVENIPGSPFEWLVFNAVPEPKLAKNRLHLDVHANAEELVRRGARVLREPDGQIGWSVLADPEGNEFCAFAQSTAAAGLSGVVAGGGRGVDSDADSGADSGADSDEERDIPIPPGVVAP
jgi:hypothetical protein